MLINTFGYLKVFLFSLLWQWALPYHQLSSVSPVVGKTGIFALFFAHKKIMADSFFIKKLHHMAGALPRAKNASSHFKVISLKSVFIPKLFRNETTSIRFRKKNKSILRDYRDETSRLQTLFDGHFRHSFCITFMNAIVIIGPRTRQWFHLGRVKGLKNWC